MQKQRYYYNYHLLLKRWILSVFKITNQQKKKIKILKKINLLILFLLTYLVKNNNLLSIRLIKKTKTTREIFDAMVNEDKVEAKIPL